MKCTHATAAFLESAARAACKAAPGEMGGLLSSEIFEEDLLKAAFAALLPHWQGAHKPEIDAFFSIYLPLFGNSCPLMADDTLAAKYAYDLSALVGRLID